MLVNSCQIEFNALCKQSCCLTPQELPQEAGIPRACDLGKYLSVRRRCVGLAYKETPRCICFCFEPVRLTKVILIVAGTTFCLPCRCPWGLDMT